MIPVWILLGTVDSRGANDRILQKPRLYALVDGRVSLCCGLVLRPCSLFARACCCIPAVLSSWSRRDYEPSHIEESYLLYHR